MFTHAAFWVAIGLVVFALGYRFYSRFVASRLFDCDEEGFVTPAYAQGDGIDYVATDRHVLLGHHFTSIAGAAPILGPAVACVYGWLPAFLWIVLGVVFIGAVHDFGALVVSIRNQGRSLGDIAGDLVGNRARVLFLCLIVILTWLVLAAFASIIGKLFHVFPASVIPVNLEIPIAVGIGWWYHKRNGGIWIPSLLALAVMWGSVFFTATDPSLQFQLPDGVAGLRPDQLWVVLLLAYSFCTCVLPVWVLLQPRDFVNSHQLFVGLGALYLALFLGNPEITAPAINPDVPTSAGGIFPILFITVACGAISGFHSLVSSGTTSKQIQSLRDARPVGYGSMLGEGCLALAATMAVAAGFSAADWKLHYGAGGDFKTATIPNFVQGASNLLEGGVAVFGATLDHTVAMTIIAVIVISFAATTLDTACRIQRFCLGELGRSWNVGFLQNRYVAAAIAAFSPLFLVVEQGDVPTWKRIWPVFGSSNQLLGAIALLLITLYLKRRGKPLLWTGLPAAFLTVITLSGLYGVITAQLRSDDPKLAVLVPAVLLLVLAVAVIWESVAALLPGRRSSADA